MEKTELDTRNSANIEEKLQISHQISTEDDDENIEDNINDNGGIAPSHRHEVVSCQSIPQGIVFSQQVHCTNFTQEDNIKSFSDANVSVSYNESGANISETSGKEPELNEYNCANEEISGHQSPSEDYDELIEDDKANDGIKSSSQDEIPLCQFKPQESTPSRKGLCSDFTEENSGQLSSDLNASDYLKENEVTNMESNSTEVIELVTYKSPNEEFSKPSHIEDHDNGMDYNNPHGCIAASCQLDDDLCQSIPQEITPSQKLTPISKIVCEHSAKGFGDLEILSEKGHKFSGCSKVNENVCKQEDSLTAVMSDTAKANGAHHSTAITQSLETYDYMSSIVADMKELHNQLASLTADIREDSFGLQSLFNEKQRKIEKSKSARKRKKQQQKFAKVSPSKSNSTSRFAQCTEDLVFGKETEVDSSLTCPVCLELFYLPRSCHPCGHIFCDPCLRRLTTNGWEEVPCPLCRTVIQSCEKHEEFDKILTETHPDIYVKRATFERHSKFRHYKLPFTPQVPLGRRFIRHLRTSTRNRRPDSSWMSHDWFKFLLGCTVGVCTSLLIMLMNRVKSINDVRDVNIMFLSLILGASLTVVVFKLFKIS